MMQNLRNDSFKKLTQSVRDREEVRGKEGKKCKPGDGNEK